MPTTTAIYNAYSHKINSLLSDIEEQFALDEHALVSITSHFHKLFNLGLSEYGHPMAMMYVVIMQPRPCVPLTSSPLVAPRSSLAYRMVQKRGNIIPHHFPFQGSHAE
jgi:hypothetical protein